MPKYSVIIPVYNRPSEVDELLQSLSTQTYKDFDILIIEDGSTESSKSIVNSFSDRLDIHYHYKVNTGPGDSRNVGMCMASGEIMIFFDSDCIIPPNYFEEVELHLTNEDLDAFGGPDNAHESFSNIQKAINYSMTSFITTGGIRGKQKQLDHFQPRSFNMGLKKNVYKNVGGFSDIHPGEDPDLSYRIMDAGFKVGLIPKAQVFHKRRIDFKKFLLQVYKFGVVRPILMKWHPSRYKWTYALPSLFLVLFTLSLGLALFVSYLFFVPIFCLMILILVESFIYTKNISISLLSILSSFLQLLGYGYGFLKSYVSIHLINKEERIVFRDFFFSKEQ